MKLFIAIFLGATAVLTLTAYRYIEPVTAQNGTSVIYQTSNDGKQGGKPFTVKLPDNLNAQQYALINYAYQVAKNDGHKNPQLLEGLIMQESHAGASLGYRVAGTQNKVGDRYFGIAQIKLAAAKEVMRKYPEMWNGLDTKTDEELQAHLILDDHFNIRVASKYVLLMGVNKNPDFGITAYNRGLGGAKSVNPSTHPYTVSVKTYANQFKSLHIVDVPASDLK
jgi:hypothetical protein